MAGKCVGETISLPEHKHVNVLNRGGLWKVNEDVIAIFSVAEAYFLSSTKKLQNKIVSKDIVNATYGELHGARKFYHSKAKFP